jgi:hypothetical protein
VSMSMAMFIVMVMVMVIFMFMFTIAVVIVPSGYCIKKKNQVPKQILSWCCQLNSITPPHPYRSKIVRWWPNTLQTTIFS